MTAFPSELYAKVGGILHREYLVFILHFTRNARPLPSQRHPCVPFVLIARSVISVASTSDVQAEKSACLAGGSTRVDALRDWISDMLERVCYLSNHTNLWPLQ